jgi:hypothetical protein
MHKLAMVTALAATASALALSALPASGQDGRPSGTLVLTGTQRPADQKTIDVKPRGESVGDRMISSETLRHNGAPVARVESECLLLDATYEGAQCIFTIMFRDGVLIGQGASVSKRVPGVDRADEDFAILGGTGRYAGVSGSVKVESTSQGHRVTVRFAP